MTLLADYQISRFVRDHNMIEPFVSEKVAGEHGLSYGLEPEGYTFRLGNEFKLLKRARNEPEGYIDPADFNENLLVPFSSVGNHPVTLFAGACMLACSLEYFKIPVDVVGFSDHKSKYQRCFLHFPSCKLHAGWEGHLTLELKNLTDFPMLLYPGEGFGHITFFYVEGASEGYEGQYQGQTGVRPA